MTAPDSVKQWQCPKCGCKWLDSKGMNFDSVVCRQCAGEITGLALTKYASQKCTERDAEVYHHGETRHQLRETLAHHARIVAEKDARIAELEHQRDRAAESLDATEAALDATFYERDALRTQLADAVETLKAIKRHSRFSTRQLQQWANDCLKRIGVTGDKP